MSSVYVIGTACTPFGKQPEASFKDLTREAYLAVLADAGLDDGGAIGNAWFGNCGMGSFGQRNIRGQVCFTPLVREGLFPERVPMINVEGGCATASMAFHGAWKDILSGQAELSLAIGVEKTFFPGDAAAHLGDLRGRHRPVRPGRVAALLREAGEQRGQALRAERRRRHAVHGHLRDAGRLAHEEVRHHAAADRRGRIKNHAMGALNPLAQYRFEMSVRAGAGRPPGELAADARDVRADRRRRGRGAAVLGALPAGPAGARCASARVKVRASVLTGGKYRELDEPGLLARGRASAPTRRPGSGRPTSTWPKCTMPPRSARSTRPRCSASASPAAAARWSSPARPRWADASPVNLSGGLVSKGHPVGATGLSMIHELAAAAARRGRSTPGSGRAHRPGRERRRRDRLRGSRLRGDAARGLLRRRGALSAAAPRPTSSAARSRRCAPAPPSRGCGRRSAAAAASPPVEPPARRSSLAQDTP